MTDHDQNTIDALWPIMAATCVDETLTWSGHARVILDAIRAGKVPGIVHAASLPLIRDEMTAMQAELNALRAERDEIKDWASFVRPLLRQISDALNIAKDEESPGLQCGFLDAIEAMKRERDAALARVKEVEGERDRLLALINTPETVDFIKAVQVEAAHQRERWPSENDAGKTVADWFWLLGYLGGKAMFNLQAGNREKGLHHIITTAAACANWHHQLTAGNNMRPGIEEPKP